MSLGNIADSSTLDTASANPTAAYRLHVHGGDDITYDTIYSGGSQITELDPISDPTDVTGIPTGLPPGPIPQPLSLIHI